MEFLSAGPFHIDRNGSSLIISVDNLNSYLLAHSENEMFWRSHVPAIHSDKNDPWLDSSNGHDTARVDILGDIQDKCR